MEIERLSEDGLSRELWRFNARGRYYGIAHVHLFLEEYHKQERPSKRHKWRSEARSRWQAFDERSYNSGISAADVPLPSDIIDQAKSELSISVHGATDRRAL